MKKNASNPLRSSFVAALSLLAVTAVFQSCSGGGKKGPPGQGSPSGAELQRIEYGRLVDIYAYRRVDAGRADRRDTNNREHVLIERDVVINAAIESDQLFDTTGEVRVDANFRFLPFDVRVGHDELLILWDDTVAGERERFVDARNRATQNLTEVAAAYRGQNVGQKPIPVVPRNAALRLVFDADLGLPRDFFQANPSALQLLEFKADPATSPPSQAFRPVPYRVIPRGKDLIVDTTLIGGEAGGGQSSTGLPLSLDQVTANLRLAIPARGASSRSLLVINDRVPELNGVDSRGDNSVIRDFRAGNPSDGRIGALADFVAPMMVGDIAMGITAIDTRDRIITLNKRFARVTVRARIPFVDGGLDSVTNLPGGPPKTPTDQPLRSGDIVYQEILSATGDRVRIRAEVLMNLDVGNIVGDTNYPALGLAVDGTDGGNSPIVRLKVSTLTATDSAGNVVRLEASDLPLGKDCTVRVRYHENVPYSSQFGSVVVSDAARRGEFLNIDPAPPLLDANRNPIPRGTLVSPNAGLGLRFDEPMDLAVIEQFENLLLTNSTLNDQNIAGLITEPKPMSLSVLAARLFDIERDATLLRLTPALGHYHEKTKVEEYWFHCMLGTNGVKDLAGNVLDLFDRRTQGVQSFSVKYTLDPAADDNLVGFHTYRFAAVDEDGTPFGSVDFFGNFQIRDGRLFAAPTQRFRGVADGQTLPLIRRDDKGECYFAGDPSSMPPIPPGNRGKCPQNPSGVAYLAPNATAFNPQPPMIYMNMARFLFGGIVEPHNPRGSRLQMTYREDDLQLSYTDASNLMLDVEGLAWAPWSGDPANYVLTFDQFDRYTLALGHSNKRPDTTWQLRLTPPPPCCEQDCASLRSSLSNTFDQNVLQGTQTVEVLTDKVYTINPGNAFRSATNTTFISYPKFTRSYTWRDQRLVTWDMVNDKAVGLGGALAATATPPQDDRTAHVSSPWVPEAQPTNFTNTVWSVGEGDFRGDRTRDHDPIALPLLVDFKVYPDDPTNGLSSGYNVFHIGHVGPLWPGNAFGCGYYNTAPWATGPCNGMEWPIYRVHSSGGIDGLNHEVLIDIPRTTTAVGGWTRDGLIGDPTQGKVQIKPGDDHIHWAQADFVRKVSLVTFGFFDTRLPNQHNLSSGFGTWPGLTNKRGIPDFHALGTTRSVQYGIQDLVALMDPPVTAQPAGTTIKVEFRGVESFTNSDTTTTPPQNAIYDKAANDNLGIDVPNRAAGRGNLLNPSYACEAYRYAMPNAYAARDAARIPANNLTPYVEEEQLDSIKSPITLTLPRFLNVRLVMENNTAVTPAVSPSLRSFSIVYRMKQR